MEYEDFLLTHLVPLISSPLDGGMASGTGRVSTVFWNGDRLLTMSRTVRLSEYLRDLEEYQGASTKLILDIAGVNDSKADYGALKKSLRRGGPYWLEAGVEDEGDLFDVLTLDPSMVALGSLRAEGVELYAEAMEVSDTCAPLLYVQSGEVLFRGHIDDLHDVTGSISDMGYERCIIMDLDSLGGSIDRSLWNRMASLDMDIIPAGGIGPEDVPFLARSGFAAAVLDPRIVEKSGPKDEDRPLETDHTLTKPRHSTNWTGY